MVQRNREGNAQSGQLFDCLFLQFFCFCFVQTCRSFAVAFRQTQFFLNQFKVVFTVGGVTQTLHGVEVVLTSHWVDGVGSLVVFLQIQTVPPGQTEGFVCCRCIPVYVLAAVIKQFVVVQLELIAVFCRNIWNQIVIELVVRVLCNRIDLCFTQTNIVYLSCLIQLESHIVRFNHLNGDGVEQGAVGIPVQWVFGVHLFVALDVGGHGVAAVVPHIFVINSSKAVHAHLINQLLGSRIEGNVRSQCIKVWFFINAGVHQCVVVRGVQSDHLAELAAFPCGQRIGFLFAQGLGVFVVFICTLNHLQRH